MDMGADLFKNVENRRNMMKNEWFYSVTCLLN